MACILLTTPFQGVTQEAVDFVAAATVYTSKYSPSFPAAGFTADQINACVLPWKHTQEHLVKLAVVQSQSNYAVDAMVFFDPNHPKNTEQTIQNLKLSTACVIPAIRFWEHQLLAKASTPQAAVSATVQFVNDLFDTGACTQKN